MTSKCGKNEKQVESVTILLPQFHVITGQKHGRKVFFSLTVITVIPLFYILVVMIVFVFKCQAKWCRFMRRFLRK